MVMWLCSVLHRDGDSQAIFKKKKKFWSICGDAQRFCYFEWYQNITGLTMMLYTENDEYLPGISQGYGMRLQIHKQGTFPIPDQEGIFISSSYETHIGLRLVSLKP